MTARNNEWRPRRFNKRPASAFIYKRVGTMTYEVVAKGGAFGEVLGRVWNGGSKNGWCWSDLLGRRHDCGWPSRESAARQLRGETEEAQAR